MTVFVYFKTGKQVGGTEYIKMFTNQDAAEIWFEENDLEGASSRSTTSPTASACAAPTPR